MGSLNRRFHGWSYKVQFLQLPRPDPKTEMKINDEKNNLLSSI